jgi:hypothetical protein
MSEIRNRLAEIAARAASATEGPWREHKSRVASSGQDWGYVPIDDADAEFIAHARTDVPALVGALEAVLEIHKPEWTSDHHDGGYYRCSADHWTLDDQTPACPTVAAIETALEPR